MKVPESSIMQVQHQMVNNPFIIQKEVPITSNSELVPLIKIATLEHVDPIIKLFTKSMPNVPLGGDYLKERNCLRDKFSRFSRFLNPCEKFLFVCFLELAKLTFLL